MLFRKILGSGGSGGGPPTKNFLGTSIINGGVTTTHSYSTSGFTSVGDCLLVMVVNYEINGSVTSVTDSNSNSWTQAVSETRAKSLSAIWYAEVSSLPSTITSTISASRDSSVMGLYAISNYSSSTPTDTASSNINGTSLTITLNSGVSSGDVIIATSHKTNDDTSTWNPSYDVDSDYSINTLASSSTYTAASGISDSSSETIQVSYAGPSRDITLAVASWK